MTGLTGKQVVITRTLHQTGELADLLIAHGAIPVLYPCIAIVPPTDTNLLDNALHQLADYDWLILTSSNTVMALAERLHSLKIVPDWRHISVAAVGDKTAALARDCLGVEVDFVPEKFTAEALATQIPIYSGTSILLPQSSIARTLVSDVLQAAGANITVVTAYETVIGQGGADVPALLQSKLIDALTFTSPSTVENFVLRIHPLPIPDLPVVCIGTVTAEAARKAGFGHVVTSDYHTIEAMIDSLRRYFSTTLIGL